MSDHFAVRPLRFIDLLYIHDSRGRPHLQCTVLQPPPKTCPSLLSLSFSYTVSPADLTDLHVVRYELERDLLALVLSNCQYSMERGQETLHEYDLPKIQQQILTRFLQGKPRITLNVSARTPC